MPLQEVISGWGQQPQEAAEIDWSNPLTRGLWLTYSPAFSQSNLLSFLANGVGQAGVSSSNRGLLSTDPRVGGPITVLLVFKTPSSFDSQECAIGQGPTGASNNTGFGFNPRHASSTYSGAFYAGSGYTVIGKPTGGPLDTDTEYVIALSIDSSNVGRCYNAGKFVSSASITGRNTTPRLALNHNSDNSDSTDSGFSNFYQVLIWDRALSDAEIESISAQPWQLFQRREWVPMAAASGGGVAGASSGTLQLAGSAAGSVIVSGASAGALAISGAAAASVRVTGASTGALSLSGTATGTVGATGVTGQSSQTLSLTGTSTGTVGISGQSAQTLALSGTAAGSVLVSGASAGTLSITGTATGNTTGAVTGASNGVLSLSGSATGTVRVSGGSAAVLQITGNAGAQIVVRVVSTGVLSMTGSATAINGDIPAAVIRASLSSRTRIRTDGAGARPAQRSTASRPRQ